jgi:AefR-like transcriptional repressor, C-terminal domain
MKVHGDKNSLFIDWRQPMALHGVRLDYREGKSPLWCKTAIQGSIPKCHIGQRHHGPDRLFPVQTQRLARLAAYHALGLEIELRRLEPRLRRLAIGEASRFPEFGLLLHEIGPGRSIGRLEKAFVHYSGLGQLDAKDLREAASNFNWLLMGGPSNDAMLLGMAAIPPEAELLSHANECVRVFLAAYGSPAIEGMT